jgi:hypothetical protein
VICTSGCGAAALAAVVGPGMHVVRADARGLAIAVAAALSAGPPRAQERLRIRAAMAKAASADAAAERFLEQVAGVHG